MQLHEYIGELLERKQVLLAERQQAQEEYDALYEETKAVVGARDQAQAQRQQAIGALRQIRDDAPHYEPVDAPCGPCLAEAALVKLGEDKP